EDTQRRRFIDTLGFEPDPFQLEGMEGVEQGDSVLVAAPTGAGKTVVGEFATHLAVVRGRRAFYTTPLKALSNQKFLDLQTRFGEGSVGLLTGDTSVNPGAPVVVMTTEVLRNMIYAGADLSDLDHVVLDEVHYLADRFRGPVWEEVIIHLPPHVSVVALSATVSNAEEFGAWMREVRGSCRIVVSERRPVPLYQHMMVDSVLYDLYAPGREGGATSGRLNPELLGAVSSSGHSGARVRGNSGRRWQSHEGASGRPPARRESRPSVLITLDRAHLLPAIVFIFSRAGCDDAVRAVLASGVVLTSKGEAARIRAVVEEAVATIPSEDHAVLGVDRWAAALERGVSAHHAGLLPVMKETVEKLFTRGLVKVVYATETLALGINMPARTVVIESLQKWNGVAHVQLSAGEYTQLSGRAGRRGIDEEGHAVVLHRGRVAPEEVAALASRRTYPLVSAFHPTYNMVVNLLSHSSRAATREVLETSFAQFQADGAVVGMARRARELQRDMDRLGEDVDCDRGDAQEYFALREELSAAQKQASRDRLLLGRRDAESTLRTLRRGDVVHYRRGRRRNHAVVLDTATGVAGQPTVQVIGTDAKLHHLSPEDASGGLDVVGRLKVAPDLRPRRVRERTELAESLRDLVRSGTLDSPKERAGVQDQRISDLEQRIRSHPVHSCPQREEHAVAGHAWVRARNEYRTLARTIEGRTNSVAKEFDRVCAVLDSLGFLEGERVTPAGEQLRSVFGERDLTVVEAVRSGAWDGLDAAELAAIASTCVFEARSEHNPDMDLPGGTGGRLARAWALTLRAQERVAAAEEQAGATPTPGADPGLMTATHAWASGSSLATALATADLQGGDFVRWVRQVMDLLDQLRRLDHPDLPDRAAQARDLLVRGVVAWSVV
ncbi:MAG: DEAD/DEAH box helicase, partial [Actinomyces sp.]|nr:DEAD/DEAH box helicase [Actinomyces sp.]